MTKRSLIILTVSVLIAEAILLGLGLWQVQRHEWKKDLLTTIETNQNRFVSLSEAPIEYAKIHATGTYLPSHTLIMPGKKYKEALGAHILMPFSTDDGIVLVNRGFVETPAQIPEPTENETIFGQIRMAPGEKPAYVPENAPDKNEWFWVDLDAIADAKNLPLLPFYIEVTHTPAPQDWPVPTPAEAKALPNNHLQYAATWFGLALVLLGVYGVYVRQQMKLAPTGKTVTPKKSQSRKSHSRKPQK